MGRLVFVENHLTMVVYESLLYCFYHCAVDDASTIITDILKVCKNGCTKEEIIEETRLSHEQLRRITAEIVDKGLLRGVYITTDTNQKPVFCRPDLEL